MIYIYDLVLNWNDKRRYEFFEWKDDDEIEYIKKMPVFRIDNFEDTLNYNIKVNNEFLQKIFNRAEIYGNRKAEQIEYACIFCNKDLNKVIAIEFNDMGESIYKSNIHFLDLTDIFDIASRIEPIHLEYAIVNENIDKDYYLTRKEIMKKNYLVNEINYCYEENNIDKIKYIYYEIFGEDSDNIKLMHDKLIDSLNNDFNYRHENIYNLIKIPNY